jgi:hypothetical protein
MRIAKTLVGVKPSVNFKAIQKNSLYVSFYLDLFFCSKKNFHKCFLRHKKELNAQVFYWANQSIHQGLATNPPPQGPKRFIIIAKISHFK